MKGFSQEEIFKTGEKAMHLCDQHGTMLIINDYPDISTSLGAAGVHVGSDDMNVAEIRAQYGQITVGGTANTFEDILRHLENGVDYIGLGPYRETQTKKNLSPILGLKGFWDILYQCKTEGIHLPVYAIGGIRMEDIAELSKTGIHGIAASSLFNRTLRKDQFVSQLEEEWLHGTIANS